MTSSMFNDLKNRKPLEIDSILGYVVNLAKLKNIDLPYSQTLKFLHWKILKEG